MKSEHLYRTSITAVCGQSIHPSGAKSLAMRPMLMGFYWTETVFPNNFMAKAIIKRKFREQRGEH